MRVLLCILLTLFLLQGAWSVDLFIPVPQELSEKNSQVADEDDNEIATININAMVLTPDHFLTVDKTKKYPLLVWIQGWGFSHHSLLPMMQTYANDGYIVAAYTPRGFWFSGGALSPFDAINLQDASSVIDWLIAHYPVDEQHIGIAGASHGAAIAVHAASVDSRIKAVGHFAGSMESLVDMLASNFTPREADIDQLALLAQLSSTTFDHVKWNNYWKNNYQIPGMITETLAWDKQLLSGQGLLKRLNQNKPAIYVVRSLYDVALPSIYVFELLKNYQGPWMVNDTYGGHSVNDALTGIFSPLWADNWQDAKLWFDHYLKQVENDIQCRKKIKVEVASSGALTRQFNYFDRFDDQNINTRVYYLHGPSLYHFQGQLNLSPPININEKQYTYSVGYAGINSLSTMEPLLPLVKRSMLMLNHNHVMTFKTATLHADLAIRGAAELSFYTHARYRSQYFVSLYEVNPWTMLGDYIGHFPFTVMSADGNSDNPEGLSQVNIRFDWLSHNVNAGHQLWLVLSAEDSYFLKLNQLDSSNDLVIAKNKLAQLSIPYIVDNQEVVMPISDNCH